MEALPTCLMWCVCWWRLVLLAPLAARPRCTLVRDPTRFLTPPLDGGGDAGGIAPLDVEGGLC